MDGSNYSDDFDWWNDVDGENDRPKEIRCQACHGSGQDRDGADCIPCEGFGSTIAAF